MLTKSAADSISYDCVVTVTPSGHYEFCRRYTDASVGVGDTYWSPGVLQVVFI